MDSATPHGGTRPGHPDTPAPAQEPAATAPFVPLTPPAVHGPVLADVVAVAGDWHGDTTWALSCLNQASAAGIRIVLHAGDFGIWPGNSGAKFLRKINRRAADLDLVLLVTPGNHENYDRIDRTPLTDRGDGFGPVRWIADHVGLLDRGHRIRFTTTDGRDREFVSLGGGPSLDYADRTPGATFWAAEAITAGDVYRVAGGGHADLMITHDAPGAPWQTPAVAEICATNPMGWPDRALAYASEQRDLVTAAYEAVWPSLLLHGHYHARSHTTLINPENGREMRIVCLPQQKQAANLVRVELSTLGVRSLTDPAGLPDL